MAGLPEIANEAWDIRQGPVVLTTVDADGVPNAIYATCVKKFSDAKLVVADNYFCKTRANIQAGSTGSILFITKDNKAFQVKGAIDYVTEGEIYDFIKADYAKAVAATVVNVEEVYSGAEQIA